MDNKQSDDQQQKREDLIDSLTPVQVISTMIEMFGINHTLTLIGWAIRWGVQGVDNGSEFRAKCLAEGVSRATAYRASLDYRRCGDELEKRFGSEVNTETLHRHVTSSDLAEYYRKSMRRTVL